MISIDEIQLLLSLNGGKRLLEHEPDIFSDLTVALVYIRNLLPEVKVSLNTPEKTLAYLLLSYGIHRKTKWPEYIETIIYENNCPTIDWHLKMYNHLNET